MFHSNKVKMIVGLFLVFASAALFPSGLSAAEGGFKLLGFDANSALGVGASYVTTSRDSSSLVTSKSMFDTTAALALARKRSKVSITLSNNAGYSVYLSGSGTGAWTAGQSLGVIYALRKKIAFSLDAAYARSSSFVNTDRAGQFTSFNANFGAGLSRSRERNSIGWDLGYSYGYTQTKRESTNEVTFTNTDQTTAGAYYGLGDNLNVGLAFAYTRTLNPENPAYSLTLSPKLDWNADLAKSRFYLKAGLGYGSVINRSSATSEQRVSHIILANLSGGYKISSRMNLETNYNRGISVDWEGDTTIADTVSILLAYAPSKKLGISAGPAFGRSTTTSDDSRKYGFRSVAAVVKYMIRRNISFSTSYLYSMNWFEGTSTFGSDSLRTHQVTGALSYIF